MRINKSTRNEAEKFCREHVEANPGRRDKWSLVCLAFLDVLEENRGIRQAMEELREAAAEVIAGDFDQNEALAAEASNRYDAADTAALGWYVDGVTE